MKIHFIGIGGIGMSALAGIAVKSGYIVSGSDIEDSYNIKHLRNLGVKIYIGHKRSNLDPKTDLIIITSSISKDNPEVLKARQLKIAMKDRGEYLGKLMKNKRSVAVAGTHGKTTISSMISVILDKAGMDPTVAVGGLIKEFGNQNWIKGKSDLIVVEACEYKSSFLKLKPSIAVISNIEKEHLDYFKNIDKIIYAFKNFLKLVPQNGFAVVNADDINIQKILTNTQFDFPIITYGMSESLAEWRIENVKEEKGQVSFDVFKNKQIIDNFIIRVPGKHNTMNALASIIVTSKLGVNLKTIKETLLEFTGAKRRMELKGEKNGIIVIDDYGHHPTEIKVTLEAIKNFYTNRKRLWCIFQPHQYSRTRLFFNDFINSFDLADKLIINDIYEVRDTKKDIQAVNSKKLVEKIQEKKEIDTLYIESFKETAKYLSKNAENGDIILTIGAGPVYQVGELFLNENCKK